jgi:hypothetical protein
LPYVGAIPGDLAVEMPGEQRVGQVLEGISEPAQPQRR